MIQFLPPHTWLHGDQKILGIDFDDVIHAGAIEANCPRNRYNMSFKTGADPEWDNWCPVFMAPGQDLEHIFDRLGKDNGFR
jgi:hypothetical protein